GCGRFSPRADFESGAAMRRPVTPDSDVSTETYETLCRDHCKPAWKVALEPFERIQTEYWRAMRERIDAMSATEVARLLAYAENGPAETNCSWLLYDAAQWLKKELPRELYARRPVPQVAQTSGTTHDTHASHGGEQ